MNTTCVKQTLIDQIRKIAAQPELCCRNPGRDFIRKRKLPLFASISFILNMHGGSLTNEVIDFFYRDGASISPSAIVQMRDKLKADAFRTLLVGFNERMEEISSAKVENGLRILAVDGSDIQIPTNPEDTDSFFPGANGQKPYNTIHLNALYDLLQNIYLDAVIQKNRKQNERRALIEMIESSSVERALLIADLGYESYNTMAHIQEKGWFYLIRIKDGKKGIVSGLDLPDSEEFDLNISMNMTRSAIKETKELFKNRNHYRYVPTNVNFDYLPRLLGSYGTEPVFYNLSYRIVRIRISEDLVETLVTNLPSEQYPSDKLKELYALRWGIETSFRSLKYTVGMLNFHSKKTECIFQEVLASLVIYNFTEWITVQVIIRKDKRKHSYKVNFSAAIHICRKFLAEKMHPPDVETLIARHIIPIRPDRKFERHSSKHCRGAAINFTYRVS